MHEPLPTLEGLPARERFIPVHERFPVPPTSIWVTSPQGSAEQRILREYVGDTGQAREAAPQSTNGRLWWDEHGRVSIFNPELAGMLVEAYTLKGDHIFDPFGGGGTRAAIAAALGRSYTGIEVREEEVDRVNARLAELGLSDLARLSHGDSTGLLSKDTYPSGSADAVVTCPPYWRLEVYSDLPEDISTQESYSGFLVRLKAAIWNTHTMLAKEGLSVWVVGEFRLPKTGELIDFPGDVIRLHQDAGFYLYDHIIYTTNNLNALRRAGIFDKTRKTVTIHEHVLVMQRAPGRRQRVGT
jgi:DNA modification methylase